MASSTGPLTVRSSRLNSSATARTPPCCSRLGPPSVFSRCSMTRGDARDDFRRDVVQARHARQHVGAQRIRQQRDELRGAGRVQVRQDQRDRLRVLAEDELRQLLGIDRRRAT